MLQGEQPTIFGDGQQSRDFTYIDNVVSANLLACTAPAKDVSGKVFNVAAGQKFSLLETYEALAELIGFTKPPLFGPPRSGDVRDSLADTARAQQAMGYKTLVDFKEGLNRTVAWYRDKEMLENPASPQALK
jgi:UDP-glucose 4-epimerase